MLCIELFLISRGIQHEDTGDACSLTYWYSYCIFWSDQRCSWLKAYVLSHSYFPLDVPFFFNQILLVNWYSFYCLWILYFWFLTLLNIDCFSLMISFDCRVKYALWQPPLNGHSNFFSLPTFHSPSLCTLSPFQGRDVGEDWPGIWNEIHSFF